MLHDAFIPASFIFCLYEVWLSPKGLQGWAEEPTYPAVFVKTPLKFMAQERKAQLKIMQCCNIHECINQEVVMYNYYSV